MIGDSLSNGITEWPYTFKAGYNSGLVSVINHAVGGSSIITDADGDPDLAMQVSDAAIDGANIIFIFLGTNDNNAGNMTTLQAEYEAGITALKASNPGAVIYSINLIPRWTDNTGTTEVDKSNIRTAIAAACTAQGVTCLDGYTGPEIVASDMEADGTHLTADGEIKLANWILGLIP